MTPFAFIDRPRPEPDNIIKYNVTLQNNASYADCFLLRSSECMYLSR